MFIHKTKCCRIHVRKQKKCVYEISKIIKLNKRLNLKKKANVNETMKMNNKDDHSYISINDNVRTRQNYTTCTIHIIILVNYDITFILCI